jgi:para-aminobenzoate synthetase
MLDSPDQASITSHVEGLDDEVMDDYDSLFSKPLLLGNSQARILFLDAYDSFTNNIVSLLETVLKVRVYVRRMDLSPYPHDRDQSTWNREHFEQVVQCFDAVVCGPGPGTPLSAKDTGAFEYLWELQRPVPVLGICLGFQHLANHFGGSIRKLGRGLHGMVRPIESLAHRDGDIFDGVPNFMATLYHSLCVDIGQDGIPEADWGRRKFSPTPTVPLLVPLAWATEHHEDGTKERILMGIKHSKRPFWGIQYHPESICTEKAGLGVIRNWWNATQRYNSEVRSSSMTPGPTPGPTQAPAEEPTPGSTPGPTPEPTYKVSDPALLAHPHMFDQLSELHGMRHYRHQDLDFFRTVDLFSHYIHETFPLPDGVSVADIVEATCDVDDESIVLDSSSEVNGDLLARFSIIALDVQHSVRFEYRVGEDVVHMRCSDHLNPDWMDETIGYDGTGSASFSPWQVISKFWFDRKREVRHFPEGLPDMFKGGLMGYVSYEAGLSPLSPGLIRKEEGDQRPDICLAWITRSIVIDHQEKKVYVQCLDSCKKMGKKWCKATVRSLQEQPWHVAAHEEEPRKKTDIKCYVTPEANYKDKIAQCQEEIRQGNSYELCLTTRAVMTRLLEDDGRSETSGTDERKPKPRRSTPWHIYKALRTRRPAPFGSFIQMGGATLLSCSPERFLSHSADGLCSMRPMKGTVRKSEEVATLDDAVKILHVPKERAENLMIVDLVRHDLHGICGSGRVLVPELMKVEEYATVFQMVTNVQGQLSNYSGTKHEPLVPYSGLDVLSSVLPPGSMTGAPKKRSCEILHRLEERERSLYSGVVGYMDIAGKGDWSVTIRSMFRWDDEVIAAPEGETGEREVWYAGAGGAITSLSTLDGEWNEMLAKLEGPLTIFRDVA